MAYEPPRMPTKDEIIKKAIELFHEANPQLPTITPEEPELKEGSYFERARAELMSGTRSALEQYLSQLESEADTVRADLGIEKPLPTSERLTELENRLAGIESRYKATKERLKEAEEELRKIREAKPSPAPSPLTPAGRAQLEQYFFRSLQASGLSPPEHAKAPTNSWWLAFDAQINPNKSLEENMKILDGLVQMIVDQERRKQPPTGLTEENKHRLEDLFKRIFTEANESYVGKLAAFRDELAKLQEDLKDVERTRAVGLAEREITEMAKRLIPYKPPPPVPMPVPVTAMPIRVVIAEERVRKIESRMCLKCREYFTIDVDLMKRVSESTTEIRGAGRVHHEPSILEFPERFYHECPNCAYEQFGYRDIYDALAYLLAEGRRSNYKKIKLTKDKLRAAGLDKTDLDEIQTLEARYRVSSS